MGRPLAPHHLDPAWGWRALGAHFCLFPLRPAGEALGSGGAPQMRSLSTTSTTSSSGAPGPSGLTRQNSTSLTGKLGALPANLDDMKVGGRPKVGESRQSRAPDGSPPAEALESVQACWVVMTTNSISKHLSRAWDLPALFSSPPRPLQCRVGNGKCSRSG